MTSEYVGHLSTGSASGIQLSGNICAGDTLVFQDAVYRSQYNYCEFQKENNNMRYLYRAYVIDLRDDEIKVIEPFIAKEVDARTIAFMRSNFNLEYMQYLEIILERVHPVGNRINQP